MDDDTSCEATIDLAALRSNAAEAARHAQGRAVIAVIKAEAYGHGAVPVGRELVACGVGDLAVVTVDEAVTLREGGLDVPILVLGGPRCAADAEQAVERSLTHALHHQESLAFVAAAARSAKRPLRVQVEIDTGMSRMGVPADSAVDFLARVRATPGLELDGVFTHFSSADESDLAPTFEQIRRFRDVLARAGEAGIHPRQVHAANSAGLLAGKEVSEALPEATAVRPGLMLYGVAPSPRMAEGLQPVMSFRARVVRVQDLAAGATVGYGATYRVPGRGSPETAGGGTRIATLQVGYADGVLRAAGNRGFVWLAGRRHPIAGRVSMDSIGVDVGDAPVAVGDEAVLFGNALAEKAGIRVEEAAGWADTIGYELLVRVGDRVPRRYVGATASVTASVD